MLMFNETELRSVTDKITALLWQGNSVATLDEKEAIFEQIHDLVTLLQRHWRSLSWFITKYPHLEFKWTIANPGTPAATETLPILVTWRQRDTEAGPLVPCKAEAVQLSSELTLNGLGKFRVFYGRYGGFVESTRDSAESTALDEMTDHMGSAWKVWRTERVSQGDTGYYSFYRKEAVAPNRDENGTPTQDRSDVEDAARNIAQRVTDEAKDLWPWAWIVVRVPFTFDTNNGEVKITSRD